MVRLALLVVAEFLVVALAYGAEVEAGLQPVETETPVEVEIVEFGPVHVACAMHTGPFDGIPAAIEQLGAELEKQGIKAAGETMIIYHSDPQTVPPEKLQWEIVVPIADEAKPVEPLKARDIEKCTVAKAHYEGPVEEMTPFYYGLVRGAFGKGYVPVGPAIETPDAEQKEGLYSSTVMFVVRKAPKLEVTFEPYGPQTIVFVEHTGSYDQIPKAIDAFIAEVEKQKVKGTGPLLGIYHNDPGGTPPDELKWDVAVAVAEGTKVAEPLKTRELPECTMAQAKYSGPVDGLADAYTALFMEVGKKGYVPAGPPMEQFGEEPKDGQYACTIMWPVRKLEQIQETGKGEIE